MSKGHKKGTGLIVALLLAGILSGCGSGENAAAPTDGAAPAQTAAVTETDAAALIAHIPTTQHFKDEAVPEADIDAILLAGVNSPSAMNGQPWHFAAVTDKAVMEEIAGSMSFGGGPGGKAPGFPGEGGPADGKGPGFPGGDAPSGGKRAGFPGGDAPSGGKRAGFPGGDAPADGKGPGLPEGERPAPPSGGGKKSGVGDSPLAIVVSCKADSEFDAGLACQNMSAEAALLGYGTKIVSSPTIALNGEKQDHFREVLGIPEDQTAVAVLLVGKEDRDTDAASGATARSPLNDVVTYVK